MTITLSLTYHRLDLDPHRNALAIDLIEKVDNADCDILELEFTPELVKLVIEGDYSAGLNEEPFKDETDERDKILDLLAGQGLDEPREVKVLEFQPD